MSSSSSNFIELAKSLDSESNFNPDSLDLIDFDGENDNGWKLAVYNGVDFKKLRSDIVTGLNKAAKNDRALSRQMLVSLVAACMRNKTVDEKSKGLSKEQIAMIRFLFKTVEDSFGSKIVSKGSKASNSALVMQRIVAAFPEIVAKIAVMINVPRSGSSSNFFMKTPGFWSPSFASLVDTDQLNQELFMKDYIQFCDEFDSLINPNQDKSKSRWKSFTGLSLSNSLVDRRQATINVLFAIDGFKARYAK